MSAEELRRLRDAEYTGRRLRRGWEAALGGRWSLPSPLTKTRTIGGVQAASIGTVAELGEMTEFHMPVVQLAISDPYPVVKGGMPRIAVALRIAPSSDIELQASLNGTDVGSPIVIAAGTGDGPPVVVQLAERFVPDDLARIECTDAGAGGAGMVVVWHFWQRLS